jgi:hypothetical protein
MVEKLSVAQWRAMADKAATRDDAPLIQFGTVECQ